MVNGMVNVDLYSAIVTKVSNVHTHAKGQDQRSFRPEVRMETHGPTDGRTEAIALPPSLMRSVTRDKRDVSF